jgi:hypothetical protein
MREGDRRYQRSSSLSRFSHRPARFAFAQRRAALGEAAQEWQRLTGSISFTRRSISVSVRLLRRTLIS